MKNVRENIWIFVLLSIVGVASFANVLNGDFMFDDASLIVDNIDVHSLGNIWKYFVSDPRSGASMPAVDMYRPLSTLTYALIYYFFGLKVFAYHSFNLLIHIINGFLVFKLFGHLRCKKWISVLFAMLFLLHPVQAESVSYISGQPDVFGAFFVLLALFLFTKPGWIAKKFPIKIAIIAILYIIGLLVKESTVVFPALAFLFFLWERKKLSVEHRKKCIHALFALGIVCFAYLVLRFTVLDFGKEALVRDAIYNQSLLVRAQTSLHYFVEYVRLVFFPLNLSIDNFFEGKDDFTLRAVIGLSIILEMLFLAFRSFFGKKILFFGFGWFFISMATVSGIVPINAPYMEHWLYIPLVGLLAIPAVFFSSLSFMSFRSKIRIITFSLIVLIAVFGVRTYLRNVDWTDTERFYENEIRLNPRAGRSYNNLGVFYLESGRYEEAEKNFLLAAKEQGDAVQFYNLGNLYSVMKQDRKAIEYFFLSLGKNSNFIHPYVGLINLLHEKVDENTLGVLNAYANISITGSLTLKDIDALKAEFVRLNLY